MISDRRPATKRLRAASTKYPALLLSQNRHRFYFATIPVDDLFDACFVARRIEDPQAGFQRALNESRADDIAKYLAGGRGSIPSNIVLSAQAEADFRYDRRTKTIAFRRVPKAFLVLDGQHRLWGYAKCPTKHRVPVAVYEGLSRADEAKLFVDINTNQRGVPAALLLDIKRLAAIESEQEAILRELFDHLSRDSRSPLVGKLSAAKSVAGRVSRVTFNRALGPLLTSGVLLDAEPADRYKLVRNFVAAFEAELQDKKLLIRSAFFEAIFELFDEIVRATINSTGKARQEDLQEIVRPLTRLDYSSAAGGRTKITKKAMTTAMQAALRKSVRISGEIL